MVSLEELPTELHCSIVRLLDPISLIAISQASTHFRCLIEPKQKHFVERLLALESLDKYGGPSPVFRSRDNHLSPGWDGKEWSTIRWACTDCLRLLPHQYFDNHSVLRLGYRKLIPGSLASMAITSWEPDGHIRRLRRHLRNGETQAASLSEKTLRKRYFVCVTAGEGSQGFVGVTSATTLELYKRCGISEFEGMSLAEFEKVTTAHKLQIFDKNALAIELERCGNKRRLRRCNECRYLRGQLKPRANGYGGTSKLPIVPSRQVAFANHLDRWFPGFSNWLESKRPTVALPLFRIYRKNAYDQPWTLYMVRCPGCACWKEIRDFRFGGIYPHWKPVTATGTRGGSQTWDSRDITESLLNESRCNRCFARENGRQCLNKVLLDWIQHLIRIQLAVLSHQLNSGWGKLSTVRAGAPQEYNSEIKHILRHMPCSRLGIFDIVSYADVALLRLGQTQWKDLWERTKRQGDTGWAGEDMDAWCEEWIREFDDTEAHWRWLMACRDELEESAGVLAEWALSRDGDAFA
ncbi:hypothetical protein BGZ61DRAFT_449900 [Ilyonectria robusta]|uniref:uncharacterized protein n=1 Tax=Ilyonectria robusta TaxID=1079257 RepID=UPI001E8EBE6F|nr:uncharacterized protein BGZ61DRAFT_449900 [Ilyonectria robusta]KAH8706433.1 hypothetical protein BGZ61DRAFT_449900 [Ilyonectria robusta]